MAQFPATRTIKEGEVVVTIRPYTGSFGDWIGFANADNVQSARTNNHSVEVWFDTDFSVRFWPDEIQVHYPTT